MSKTTTNLAIGSFILGALLLLFLSLIYVSGSDFFSPRERYVMYFDGSVQGLQAGAPVKLKGVELGQVVDIDVVLLPDNTVVNMVTADLNLDGISGGLAETRDNLVGNLVDAGLRGQLNYQSLLTGLLYIELDFFPDSPYTLLDLQDQYPEFPTRQTQIQMILDEVVQFDLQALANSLRSLIEGASELLRSGRIEQSMESFDAAVLALRDTAQSLQSASLQIGDEAETVSAALTETLAGLNGLVAATSDSLPALGSEIESTLSELRQAADALGGFAESASGTFAEDSRFVEELTRAAGDVSRAAESLRRLSETLEREPESLLRGRRSN